jgi:hypothetical protein
MSDDFTDCIFTKDDPEIAVTITHHRDMLVFGGKVEQDYRFLTYVFPDAAGNVEARVYLDDTQNVQIIEPIYSKPIPDHILFYLQRRFRTIDQVGGSNGNVEIWKWTPPKKRK